MLTGSQQEKLPTPPGLGNFGSQQRALDPMSEMNVSRDRTDFKGEPSRENEVLTEAISQVPANVGAVGGELIVGKAQSISSPNKN